ncbi:MAG: hypothetical protein JRJ12_07055 [Deltaproteobacteria bacterium]|nr:hypothetical protein [Deltaproteobacteria bacterium]MBW2071137.1 hypothetical protein [Deltaproteobacteria bacterium]
MTENNTAHKLRFMDLMQRCFPFRWKRYWDCSIKDFDVQVMMLDMKDPQTSPADRLLLHIMLSIKNNHQEPGQLEIPGAPQQTFQDLDKEQQRILHQWMHDYGCFDISALVQIGARLKADFCRDSKHSEHSSSQANCCQLCCNGE